MPSTMCHVLFGEESFRKIKSRGFILSRERFLSGSILPDLAKNKKSTHHYPSSSDTFFIPDLDAARRRYSRIGDISIRLGIEGHLLLDAYFTKEFLSRRYMYDPETMTVVKRDDPEKTWSLDDFFSHKGLYRAYGSLNSYILESFHMSKDWLEAIPRDIPHTGVSTLDDRNTEDWLNTFECHLDDPPAEEFFAVEELIDFINGIVDDFVDYAINEILQLPKCKRVKLSPVIFISGTQNFSAHWETLREGITETVLGNPNISSDLKATVEDFVIASCELYQSYCESRQGEKSIYLDVTDFINNVARKGLNYYRQEPETSHSLTLHKMHSDIDYPNTLKQTLHGLELPIDGAIRTSKEWVKPLTDILEALISADGDLYRLVVSYSTF